MAGNLRFALGLETGQFTAGAKSAAASVSRIRDSFAGVARSAGAARAAVSGAFGGMLSTASKLGNVLSGIPALGGLIKGAFDGISLPSKLAAEAESTAVAFRTLVGDSAKANAALGEVRKLAESTPFEFPELAGAARSLVAFGEDSDNVARVLRRVGDVAAGTQQPIGELATLYGKARVAGTLFAEDVNQLTERGVPILQEFAKQLGVGVDQVKKMGSEGKITFSMLERAFIDMTAGSGKFAGMMDEASRTMDGKLSTLGDSFKGVMTAVGEGLNKALKPLVGDAAAGLDGLKARAAEIGDMVGDAINFGAVTLEQGKMGELIAEAFRFGGYQAADTLTKAFDWGAGMIAASLISALPEIVVGKDAKAEAQGAKTNLLTKGLDAGGLGFAALTAAAEDARKEFLRTAGILAEMAGNRKAIAAGEELKRQSAKEQKRKFLEEAEFLKNYVPQGPEMPAPAWQGPLQAIPFEGPMPENGGPGKAAAAATKKAGMSAPGARSMRDALTDSFSSSAADAMGGAGGTGTGDGAEDGGPKKRTLLERMQRGHQRQTGTNGKRMGWSAYLNSRMLSSSQRAELAGSRPMATDKRGGLARGRAGADAAGGQGGGAGAGGGEAQLMAEAAQATIKNLPEILRALTRLQTA